MTVADFQPISDGACGEDDFVCVVWCFTFSDSLYFPFYCLIFPYQSDPCAAFQSLFSQANNFCVIELC